MDGAGRGDGEELNTHHCAGLNSLILPQEERYGEKSQSSAPKEPKAELREQRLTIPAVLASDGNLAQRGSRLVLGCHGISRSSQA